MSAVCFEVHQVLCLPRDLRFEVHKVLHLPRNLHFEVDKVLRLPRNLALRLTAVPATKSANEPHVQQSRLTAPVTKSELLDQHHIQKGLRLPRKLHFEVKQLRSLALVTKTRLWSTKARGFPTRLPRKVTTMYENARPHNESAVVGRNALRGFREACMYCK